MSTKDYQKGFEQGQADANREKGFVEIFYDSVVPDRLPCEKSQEFQTGYEQGQENARSNK